MDAARLQVWEAMYDRPGDPWPRGSGHVPIGPIGSAARDKAYVEPGGSFSPTVGSFGISFWVVGPTGAIVTTSDTMPLEQTRASYLPGPGIAIATPFYDATWDVGAIAGVRLTLVSHVADGVIWRSSFAVLARRPAPYTTSGWTTTCSG